MNLLCLLADISRKSDLEERLRRDPVAVLEKYNLTLKDFNRHTKSYKALSLQLVRDVKLMKAKTRNGGVGPLIWGAISSTVSLDDVTQDPDPAKAGEEFTLSLSGAGFAKGMVVFFASAKAVLADPGHQPQADSVKVVSATKAIAKGSMSKRGLYSVTVAVPNGDNCYALAEDGGALKIV
jgi:hypothetical protein